MRAFRKLWSRMTVFALFMLVGTGIVERNSFRSCADTESEVTTTNAENGMNSVLPLAKSPLTAEQARDIQQQWAKRIDRPLVLTNSIGMKKPNAFGLYDMHGGVWEWCADPRRAHALHHPGSPQHVAIFPRRILATAIRVMDQLTAWLSIANGPSQRREYQFLPHRVLVGPTHDAS